MGGAQYIAAVVVMIRRPSLPGNKTHLRASVLVIDYSVTNSPNTQQLYYLPVSVSQESGSGLAGWFRLRVTHEGAFKVTAGLQSSEGLGGANGPTFWLTRTAVGRRPQFFLPHGPFHTLSS